MRCAQIKFGHGFKLPGSIIHWAKPKAALEKKAHTRGGHAKTMHPGKKSQSHATERKLRRRLLHRRRLHIAVKKKMMRWAGCMDPMKAMRDGQRADWWVVFPKRRRFSTRRVSSLRCNPASDQPPSIDTIPPTDGEPGGGGGHHHTRGDCKVRGTRRAA